MNTKRLTGPEAAERIEQVAPGSVARTTPDAPYLKHESLVETMRQLESHPECEFKILTNLCGVDYWDRMEVVYHLQSLDRNELMTVKTDVDREDARCPSVFPVWHGAWMQECEAYDLFGINFEGHSGLYRILLWEGFPGWPLRKDFLSMPGGLQPGLNEFAGTSRRPEPPIREVDE
ncbi:MAG: NADH-quinone oxidoreductase subunit C [Dehalococcoidia bacterium]|nr:NADH-quinone oxidoreductase subunit C [Dehalococcoidia bacterium]